jgi:lauroyl/myristoyl acyltransferase
MAEVASTAAPFPPPPHFPRELSAPWVVPWRENPGSRAGVLAWAEYALVRASLYGVGRLPDGARALLLDALARVAHAVDARHRRAAREWIEQALGPGIGERELDRRVRLAFRHLLRVTLEAERLDRVLGPRELRERVEVVRTPDVDRLLAAKRGTLLVGAHFGDWEGALSVLAWIGFDPLYIVSRPIRNRYLSRYAQRSREMRGVRILARNGAMQVIPHVLAGGGNVGMFLDQRARHRPVHAPFFGREAACERAPSVLARRSRCPILFASGVFGEQPLSWRVELGPVLWPEETRRMDAVELTTRINAELERRILAHPDQQLWVHDRYRERRPRARELESDAADAADED